ncbi:hypothetical protein FNV43_RR26802 [Rhamnella rubrinervis]|uniref:Protein kinase domain-containing protein n=1 Tax=Rhamnella rubrinervis TaxID=2594499 RepID=A0A8K0DPZ4_9ROSA|nr:hypothetical protein FNV43_RR26802 [Rhamnella rubrinervis]
MFSPSNIESCKSSCLNDCLCAAAIFAKNTCWKKKLPLSNGRAKQFSTTSLLKLRNDSSPQSPHNPPNNDKELNKLIIVMSAFLGSSVFVNFIFVVAICIGFFFYFKRNLVGTLPGDSSVQSDLRRMLKDNNNEFKTEVGVIGQTHHKNLVRLLGYCEEKQHRLLVYEYLRNGTLSSFLFGDLKPSWKQRTQIAFGIARGLVYLHEECSTQIIHCDIKPQNILLDEYNNARISDFGSKLLFMNQSHTKTNIRGTKGYVAPDWFMAAPVSVKVDVYSFGVVLTEIIRCRRNVEMEVDEEEKRILTDWVYDCNLDGKLDALVENDTEAMNEVKMVERFVMVVIWCLQEDPNIRPTMKKVMLMLEGIVQVPVPPCPFSFTSIN